MTLLVVDDEPMILRLLDQVLVQAGHRVLTAPRADVALALARACPIDLLATDFRLPGMNGRALAEAVTREQPQARVLILSAYADAGDAALREHPEWRFLAKPFLLDAFLRLVDAPAIVMTAP